MKKKVFSWLCFTALMFFLYDLIWALEDYQELKHWITQDYVLTVDLACCAFFALSSKIVSGLIMRRNFVFTVTGQHAILLGIVILVPNMFLAFLLECLVDGLIFETPYEDVWFNAYSLGLISTLLSYIYTIDHYIRINLTQQEENKNLRLKLLKTQLNPHFLFNSLSVLTGLAIDNPEKTKDYIVKLSKIYRYVLNSMDSDEITIPDALAFINNYMDMLRLRYENVDLNVREFPYGRKEYVLSLSLQLLIENAVKHNAASPADRLHIEIDRKDDMLVVSNNILRRNRRNAPGRPSGGMGLANLKKRYIARCGRALTVEQDQHNFKVFIPIIEK